MACHALTNWTTESFDNSVAEFEYLSMSCQWLIQLKWYQAGMFDGELKCVMSVKQEAQAQVLNMLQTWQPDLKPGLSD